MPLSLDDILKLPTNPTPEHLMSLGLLPQPAPPVPPPSLVPPATVGTKLTPPTNLASPSAVRPMTPPNNFVKGETAGVPDAEAERIGIRVPDQRAHHAIEAAPELGRSAALPESSVAPMVKPMQPAEPPSPLFHSEPTEHSALPYIGAAPSVPVATPDPQNLLDRPKSSLMSFASREEARKHGEDLRAPAGSPAVIPEIGSADAQRVELAKRADEKANPWGSAENHPGLLGKIGHVAARIGNIAGDIVAPRTMALIPGTELNKKAEERTDQARLDKAETQEREAANEKSEEGLRKSQSANLESEIRERDNKNEQSLVTDAQGNVTGWKDKKGLHGLDDADTPQSIKDIATNTTNKEKPTFEKTEDGNIVALSKGADGKVQSEVVYKGDPKLETKLDTRIVNGVPHSILINGRTGADIKDLGQTKIAGDTQKEHGIEVVRAYDKNGKMHLLSQDDARAAGYTGIMKASDADIEKAQTHTVTLNDMQSKLNDVVASRKALDQGTGQRAIIAKALSDKKNTTLGQLIDAGVMSGSTPETQEYVQSVLSLRESALGLPKEITGGSRVSEIQGSALWGTLPGGASLNGEYALNQAKKFQANIDRLRERAPEVRGQSITDTHADLAQGEGKFSVAAGRKTYHFKDQKSLDAFKHDAGIK